ncbi:MAG: hypothetical protein SPL52_15430 [Fibrobacter sp.]|nr:hypothetical protein [Fibrobacter sp.]
MKTTKITTIFLGMASAMAFAQEGSACIPFVNGTGNYDKHCYNEGLLEMEKGKCYTFNPARVAEAPVQQWVNNIASQTWWWVETPCIEGVSSSSVEPESSSSEIVEPESSSSEIVEPESSSSEIVEPESSSSETPVSSSSAEPIVVSNCIEFVNGSGNFTENCYNAGLLEMEEGKCYALNEDRYNDVKNQLWINNVASQVWWWKVVPCGTEISSSSVEESSSSEEVSSSSEEPESSSSEEVSSSSEEPESSSSEEVSSSSEEPESSSSEEVSSSSEEPESSSSEEVSSSSEEPESSSSEEVSSSSEVVVSKCEEFVRGTGNYTTDKCYNAGLADMEEGKCYKLKDDRANDVKGQQWINDRANDNWWWEETECGEVVVSSSSEESSSSVESSSSEESSSSVESSSSEESSSSVESSSSEESSSSSEPESSSSEIVVTKCVEFVNGSGDYNGKCFNAGLNEMAEGKCYALNPDRGQVNDIWINNRAVDTYWWSEVSCGDDVVAPKAPILAEPKPAPAKVIGRDNGTTALATAVEAKASMAVANNMLSIATTSNGTKSVKVFSVRGDVLLSETFSGAAKTVDMAQFAGKGAVIVRLVEGRKVLATKRIAVR